MSGNDCVLFSLRGRQTDMIAKARTRQKGAKEEEEYRDGFVAS